MKWQWVWRKITCQVWCLLEIFYSHWVNYLPTVLFLSACGPGYELKRYPQHVHLNSQVVEQANSRLQRIKGSLSYMTQTNFIKHCKLYVWGQNEAVLSKLWVLKVAQQSDFI